MSENNSQAAYTQIAARIKELRQITGRSVEDMAAITNVTIEEYLKAENGESDFSFTFVHNCAKAFNVDITALITGDDAKLSSFSIVRAGEGLPLERRKGFRYNHLASFFKGRLSEPFLVTAKYDASAQNRPIPLSSHDGEEFDYVLDGTLKINIDGHIDTLSIGDAVYYNSSVPHGMIAENGKDCTFIAVVTDALGRASEYHSSLTVPTEKNINAKHYGKFINTTEDDNGNLLSIDFNDTDKFNFAYDVLDAAAEKCPYKLAMLHLDNNKNERRLTFRDISLMSNQAANYFVSLGIKAGDRVMLVLKCNWQFWIAIMALCKIGATVIPATKLLMEKDFVYRFEKAGISALLCTADGTVAAEAENAVGKCAVKIKKIIVNGKRDGWSEFDGVFESFSTKFPRSESTPCGNDTMLMFFSSGTTGYPKIAMHSFKYPLGHFITAKYWHMVDPDGLHFTISDTGWGKALWGKLYGQWLCEAAVFTYDFDKFDAHDILPLFAKYGITTFCAPPTMYRFFIREDLNKYDMSSLKNAAIAGEALNPEVYQRFYEATGLKLREGFGQTETTLAVGNLNGTELKAGSMGKPSPLYNIDLVDNDGNPVKTGETGEIVIRTDNGIPCGLFQGYYDNDSPDHIDHEKTDAVWHDGMYHTGDTAWRDEDGYFRYVGRTDDLIKSSGYRIGPFEIESVLMELPYVLECAVTGVPDEVRGQVVKATIVLTKDYAAENSDTLKKEIQNYVKTHTAPYKYPRVVEFVKELPKTISGKIKRSEIRKSN